MRKITVQGTGVVSVKPDTVSLEMELETRDKQYDEAVDQAEKRVEKLREALLTEGFSGDELRTAGFNVRTDYENVHEDNVYRRVLTGYICTYTLRLTFPLDAERLSAALGAVGGSGARPGITIGFTVREPETVRDIALQDAVQKARRSAEALCKASGEELGELQRIEYGRGEPCFNSDTRCVTLNEAVPKAMGFAMVETPPEDIKVTETAVFTWELE